jgi:ribosomal subunit interface protein
MKTHYAARGIELTAELEKYANRKLIRVARKIPRRFKAGAACEVVFSRVVREGNKLTTCTIVLSLATTTMQAEEATQHAYAALDIAAVHIEQQLKEYVHMQRRGLLRRRQNDEE